MGEKGKINEFVLSTNATEKEGSNREGSHKLKWKASLKKTQYRD